MNNSVPINTRLDNNEQVFQLMHASFKLIQELLTIYGV